MTGRKKPRILSHDPSHEHAIFKARPIQQPVIPPDQAKPRGPASSAASLSTEPEKQPPTQQGKVSAKRQDLEDTTQIQIKLMPLARHRADLEMLAAQGYQTSLILRGAGKTAHTKTITFDQYIEPKDREYWKEHSLLWRYRISTSALAELRSSAKDPLNALPLAQLVREQITWAWIESVDEAIAQVKKGL